MKSIPRFLALLSVSGTFALCPQANSQNLPGLLGFTIEGSCINATTDRASSILITDNDLTNGYTAGFVLQDASTRLNPTGPQGCAAIRRGTASSNSDYPHASALWSEPLTVNNASAEQSFELIFQVDQDNADDTLSTPDQIRVFEGRAGQAAPLDRFTAGPIDGQGTTAVPKPSAAMIGALGVLLLLRNRR